MKILNIGLFLGIFAGVLVFSSTAHASSFVTISGIANIDRGRSVSDSLQVCFRELETGQMPCALTDNNGNYMISLDSTKTYHTALDGNVSGLDFFSSGLRIDYPQTSGTLNLTLKTSMVSSMPLKDQFGSIVAGAPAALSHTNQPNIDNVDFSATGINPYKSYFDGMRPVSYSTATTSSDGTADFIISQTTNYTYSANGPANTNYSRYGATVGNVSNFQTGQIVLAYPTWDAYIPGAGASPSYVYTNSVATVQWNPLITGATTYNLYKTGPDTIPANIVGELGEFVTNLSGTTYTSPQLAVNGVYFYRLVALDEFGNVKAINPSQNAPIIHLDKVAPIGGPVSMSKTTITSRTGPVTITMPSSDNVAMNRGEYYIDSNPGFGNGISIPFNGTAVSTSTSSLASLSKGNHIMYIRAMDKAGNWSPSSSINFSVK